MSTSKVSSLVDELSAAYKTEMAGYAFYKYAAGITDDEHGKNFFEHLAAEELEHIDVISSIVNQVKGSAKWLTYEEALKKGVAARSTKGLPIYPDRNDVLERLKKDQTEENALKIAIETEENAVKSYEKLLKESAKSPEEKVFLVKLLEMEKGHLKLLRWELESLMKDGFWCDFMEFDVEKENS